MRDSSGSSTGRNRETTDRADEHPFTKGRSPAPPPLTDHTKGRSPAPPPLTDHTKGRSPVLPHPLEEVPKARQIEPVSLPGQGPPATG